jgi:SAM-dependent methyltransferase
MKTFDNQKQDLNHYTPNDILSMNYNEIIGIVRETNRPPGGLESIIRIAQNSFLRPTSKVLEIGTSTGFTAIELARLVGCHVKAIDINPVSLAEARRRAMENNVADLVDTEVQDATHTNFGESVFDLVFCGNVTSLINEREKVLAEYCRVLKDGGFLAAIPMYYVREPTDALVQRVSQAIQVRITPAYKPQWIDFFDRRPLVLFWKEDYLFDFVEDQVIDEFVDCLTSGEHLQQLMPDTREALLRRYREFIYLFRDNLSHMGYTLILLRKEQYPRDPELFSSHLAPRAQAGETPNPR